jgi:hypothetical protein
VLVTITEVESVDKLRSVIIARAETLGLSAYAIAKQCVAPEGAKTPDPDTVKRYLNGDVSLNSRYVSQICDVLGLELRTSGRRKK